jgi:hypothetical protein
VTVLSVSRLPTRFTQITDALAPAELSGGSRSAECFASGAAELLVCQMFVGITRAMHGVCVASRAGAMTRWCGTAPRSPQSLAIGVSESL